MTVKNMEKHRREKTKNDFKPFSRAFLIIMVFTITLLSINLVTGWQFDNTKTYNPELKEVTIKNAFGLGGDVAKIKLTSELNIIVPRGYQKVAEFDLIHIKDDNGGLNKLEFYNIKNSMNKVERNFDFKVKGINEIIINDYKTICKDVWNETNQSMSKDCSSKLIGAHKENKVVWNDYNFKELIKNEKITIGIFTDVQKGDKIEWIPTFYGVEIEEWATWTESLNTNLKAYYKLDDGGNEIIDSVGNYNGTNQGAAANVTGIIGTAYDFTSGDPDWINLSQSNPNSFFDDFSVSMWFNADAIQTGVIFMNGATGSGSENLWYFHTGGSTTNCEMVVRDSGGNAISLTNISYGTNAWINVVIVYDDTAKSFIAYKNGTEYGRSGTNTLNRQNDSGEWIIGRFTGLNIHKFDGTIDEIGVWNRKLSASEVSDLWNGGAGITYTTDFNVEPNVTLNSPIDTYNSTSPTIIFNCSASDDSGIVNVSLLINNSIVSTNSSGVNNSDYIFTYSLTGGAGAYNWTCSATDNGNKTTTPTVRTLTYSNDLTVTLNDPVNTYNSTNATIIFNGTASDDVAIINVSLYLNGILNETNLSGVNNSNYLFTKTLSDGKYNWTYEACDTTGCIKATNRSLSINTTPMIKFVSLTITNGTDLTTTSIYGNISLTETYFDNLTFYLYNSTGLYKNITFTNTTRFYNFTNLIDNDYYLNATIWTTTRQINSTETRQYNINTTPFIEFITPTTTDNSNLTVNYIYSTINLTETYFDNLTFYLYNSTGLYKNITFTNTTRFYNFTNLIDGTYYFNSTVWTTTNQDNNTGTRTVYIDSNAPTITIVYPVNETIYFPEDYTNATTINANLNFTVTDSHLDTCWYYNSTDNITINCSHNATINVSWGEYTFIVYANDTFGHVGKKDVTATWNYNILENSRTFSPTLITGASTNFSINVSFNDSKFTNSIGYLIYNETSYTATRTGGSGTYTFRKELTIPKLSAETNMTFYWNFTLNNGTNNYYTGHSNNQTVTIINIDNCTAYSNLLYNFTIVDERSQNSFNVTFYNQTVELNMQIFSTDGLTMIQNLSLSYNETNPFAVCLNTNLSDGESYLIDLQLQYDADTYASEFYNIQKATLTSSSLATNITLYDLDDDNAQEFKISYKDENLLPVENVLLQIQRKYIDEGVFKIVEIPKTDSNGETIGHLELSDVIYNIIVTKDGVVLSTFNNIIAFCDNVATGDCTIDLSSALSHVQPTDYTVLEDFAFTKQWDLSSRIFNITYTIPSSTSRTVTLNGTLSDGLGTTNVCSSTLTSASGILVCDVPISFGNSSVIFKVYSDNIQKAEIFVSLWDDPSSIYGTSRIFLYMFLILTLVSVGLSSQPIVIGFFLFLGAVLSLVLNVIPNTGLWGAGATILWLLIAIVLVIIKGVNRN